MNLGQWRLGCQRSNYDFRVSAALYIAGPDGSRDVLGPDGLTYHVEPGQPIPTPTITLEYEQLQAFIDGLWEMGLRPKSRRFDQEMDLKDKHLQDMRKIAFKGLGINDAQAQ